MQSVTNTEIAIKADETMTFTRNKYKCRNKQRGGNNQTNTKS